MAASRPTRCEFCGQDDDQCIPLEGEWADLGICPECVADSTPATEACDLCGKHVDRSEFDLFVPVRTDDGELAGFRHAVCELERRMQDGTFGG